MRRRLFLWIDHLAGWEAAEDYEAACAARYVLDNDELWFKYTEARDKYIELFEQIRKVAKREPPSGEDLEYYKQGEET